MLKETGFLLHGDNGDAKKNGVVCGTVRKVRMGSYDIAGISSRWRPNPSVAVPPDVWQRGHRGSKHLPNPRGNGKECGAKEEWIWQSCLNVTVTAALSESTHHKHSCNFVAFHCNLQ